MAPCESVTGGNVCHQPGPRHNNCRCFRVCLMMTVFVCGPDGFLPPSTAIIHATHNPDFSALTRVVAPLWQPPLFIEARRH